MKAMMGKAKIYSGKPNSYHTIWSENFLSRQLSNDWPVWLLSHFYPTKTLIVPNLTIPLPWPIWHDVLMCRGESTQISLEIFNFYKKKL